LEIGKTDEVLVEKYTLPKPHFDLKIVTEIDIKDS
jgi:hypothetical protein